MKKNKIISLLIVAIFFLGNIKLVQGFEREGKIHKNIYVEDIDLSNLSKKEAKDKITKVINENNELILKFSEGNYYINKNDLGVSYMVNEAIDEAYNVCKENKFLEDIKVKINLDLGKKKIITLKYNYDDQKLNECIENIGNELYISPVNATIRVDNGKFVKTKEVYGRNINKDILKEKFIQSFEDIYVNSIDIPEQNIEPKYKEDELSKIDTVLGTYETYFNPKVINRVENIKIASNATKNILIGKDEEFSFNSIIIKSKAAKEMKEAPVIINGKVEKGLGGGICQVSSTIYNAALYAGMNITNVKNHSIPSAYISKGRDATVSLGDIDFKFRNKFNTPVLIYNEVFDNRIVSTIYGNKEDKKEIEIITEVTETLPNKTIEKESKDLYEGERVVEQDGRIGYKVSTFRIYKSESQERKELIYNSFYPPMDKVIINGSKKKEEHKQPHYKGLNIFTEYV
ncbi:Uncharacterized vancomycin resistance protein [uncultured Clostridium sp.]|nr:Uncharacterized vancomycin resistance protein [uncultured Clostridium sp.]